MIITNKFIDKLHSIHFDTSNKYQKFLDYFLTFLVILNVSFIMIESMNNYEIIYKKEFLYLELVFTLIFSLEYITKVIASYKRENYILSFWGIIDLVATLPMLLQFFTLSSKYFAVLRFIRILRILKLLKMNKFRKESKYLLNSLKRSLFKIGIFLIAVLYLVIILGTLMYVIEKKQSTFNSIPQSIYWAIVTITTVGYGDIVPSTSLGKLVSSIVMLLGYAIIAVPTGIIGSDFYSEYKNLSCPKCGKKLEYDSNFCNRCGEKITRK